MTKNIDETAAFRGRPRDTRALFWALSMAVLIWATPRTVAAANLCVPQANGVPALGGAPNWHNDAPGEPQYWPRLDDPRWRGSLAKSWGNGASEHVQFRAVRDANSLYLSWWVRVDPWLTPNADRLFVAFSPGGTAKDELIEVRPFTIATADIVAQTPLSTSTRLRPSAGVAFGAAEATEPTWLVSPMGKTKVWLSVTEQAWAINMVVPVAAAFNDGINLQPTFKMWFEVQVTTSATTFTPYRLVDALSKSAVETGTDTTTWAAMSRTHDPSDPVNCAQVISLTSSDVGTKNEESGVPRPHRIALNAPNTFFARPTNGTSSDVLANQICAQFRLANWGTQPDWNNVPNPTASLWKLISPACGIPGGRTNPAPIGHGTKASATSLLPVPANEITFTWTPVTTPDSNDVDRCEFIGKSGVPAVPGTPAIPGDLTCSNPTPTRRQHQCMLVELSGSGLTYNPASVYRNMDFVDASTFERDAEVSVAGLASLAGATNRDVFLYVKTNNMPPDVNVKQPVSVMRDLEKVEKIPDGKGGNDDRRGAIGTAAGPAVNHSPNAPFDTLDQVLPTLVVHAYHDTGETVTENGTTMKVLRPQSSFGYYVRHEGPLEGWSTALSGAQLIGPNFYRLGVVQGGSAVVKTTIVAREQGFKLWWLILLLALLLLVILVLKVFRKKTP